MLYLYSVINLSYPHMGAVKISSGRRGRNFAYKLLFKPFKTIFKIALSIKKDKVIPVTGNGDQ